jgi:hypothetical protein
MIDDLNLRERQPQENAARVEEDAPDRPRSRSTCLFAPPSDWTDLPDLDVAQRLITLSLAGLGDELTWASY